jgi:alkyl hydroperoxide reductase subunit AhpC
VAAVADRRAEIESLGYEVVVVGQNNTQEQAVEWNASDVVNRGYLCDFVHVCDPDRVLYRKLGLKRSLSGVWGVLSINFYSEGHEMHAAKDGQDLNQMGGDFVIDAAGVVRLAYYSATNTDRPSFDAIKQACAPADATRRAVTIGAATGLRPES